MSISTVSNYNIDNYEYFVSVEPITIRHILANQEIVTPSTIKGYVQKYMPNVKKGNWTSKRSINSSMLVNASDCSINLPKTVTEQGYITIPKYSNETPDLRNKAMLVDILNKGTRNEIKIYNIPAGTKFMAEVVNGDPTTIKYTGKV